ncbi:DMT family transporter [Asticcacaulis biprosthecium]|nr:DMT family transporter [Asticcacaulis biprosthecium]
MSLRAYALLILTNFLWAGNSVAGKLAVGHIEPVLLTSLRWVFACLIILVLAVPQLKRDWPVINVKWPLLLGYGAIGFTLFNLLLYMALNHTSTVNVMIEQSGIPLVIFLANFALFRLRATLAQIAGFVLTFCGVLVTATHGDIRQLLHLNLNIGDAMMLVAVLVYAGYTVALRWKPDLHWKTFLATSCIGALVACVPALIWRYHNAPVTWPDAQGWWVVAYAAVFPSLIAAGAYIAAIELIGSNRAGLFINLLPIFGVILAVLILREPLHGFHIAALALVCAGIVLAEWSRIRAGLAERTIAP